jgi:hypothetical protein
LEHPTQVAIQASARTGTIPIIAEIGGISTVFLARFPRNLGFLGGKTVEIPPISAITGFGRLPRVALKGYFGPISVERIGALHWAEKLGPWLVGLRRSLVKYVA